jgi:hypothetical protein
MSSYIYKVCRISFFVYDYILKDNHFLPFMYVALIPFLLSHIPSKVKGNHFLPLKYVAPIPLYPLIYSN